MTKRQRGRLYASKNKPKSPITKQRRVCILNANGCVTNVTLRQPASSGAKVTTAWDHWFDHQRQVGGGLIASGHVFSDGCIFHERCV
ncbi:unnamed protein product [Brassica oleracea var. botrytis]|uniref:(rape) hypothetical protein n=1 Tax=Brassica napus TaxID=3708 RepID=A0A078IBX2_BRANA|nr:unnamed protein product [Brassica napus]CDY46733.1 BnaCnng14360D [Brassica napus]